LRLTLRTLLAYLDDTLEPAQAKLIGQKVAESDTAQELIARIKQVTRRRRLTIPPATGPGSKLDPNVVADYLDNTLNADQTAEVEQTCLGSDVHLADIAACHQILTLVLGEPVLIPPSSRQRMYGLVKGREAIPFRKPPAGPDHEPEPVPDFETDETLRLGLPAYRARGSWSSQLAVVGGGVAAGLLLILAIWQALRLPQQADKEPAGTQAQAKSPIKDGTAAGTTEGEKQNTEPEAKQEDENKGATQTEKKKVPPPVKGGKEGDTGKEQHKPPETVGTEDKKPNKDKLHPPGPEASVEAPSTVERPAGQYFPLVPEGAGLLLQRPPKGPWRLLDKNDAAVFTGRALASLPGCRSVVQLDSGLRLILWGALREQLFFPPVQESRAVLHHHPTLDLDITLQRGRVTLANTRKKPLQARVRFDNPTNPSLPEAWDVTLETAGAEVLFDLWHFYPRDEPFFPDLKDSKRVGPAAAMHLLVLKGSVSLRRDDHTIRIDAPPGPALLPWNSFKGAQGAVPMQMVPDWATAKPGLPEGLDAKVRDRLSKEREEMIRARESLITSLSGRGERADVALASFLKSTNRDEEILAVRCFAALDDLPDLVDQLSDEDRPAVRLAAVDALRSWIAAGRDNDYQLLDVLKTKYTKIEADNIMRLLHNISTQAAARPETYDFLITLLDTPKLALRELGAWHLYRLAPAQAATISVPYSAAAPAAARQRIQMEWGKLLQTGKLPPAQSGPPPGK
jgi:hypothetical protein